VVVLLITAYAGVLRYYGLGSQSFWIDEGVSFVHARAILDHGYPRLPNGQVSWESAPAHYLMAPGLWLSGEPHMGGRLISALVGLLTVPIFFFFARAAGASRLQAWPGLFCMAFLACEVAWSRQARYYSFLQFFGICGLACLIAYLERKRIAYVIASAALLLLCVFTHRAGYLFLLIGGGAWAMHVRWTGRRVLIGAALVFIVAGCLHLAPGNSGLAVTFGDVWKPSETNYAWLYFDYLDEQLGSLLFLAPIGGLIMVMLRPRWGIPLAVGALSYFVVIAWRTQLFAFRYTFPLMWILILFAACALAFPVEALWKRASKAARIASLASAAGGLVVLLSAHWTLVPKVEYWLGFTEPQPKWASGYGLIAEHYDKLQVLDGEQRGLNIISSFPFLNGIYLRGRSVQSYYIPVSHTGYPGELQAQSPYVPAPVVGADDLDRIDGYLILDDMAWRMMGNAQMVEYLDKHKPSVVIKDRFNLYIWRTGPATEHVP